MDNRLNEIFGFLALMDNPRKADVIIGFGHFDMNIPRQCCELYLKGYGKKIIYTGGVGAGSADFKNPEATEFLHYAKEHFPQIPPEDILIEDRSTNTGENVRFTMQLMKDKIPDFNFENGVRSAILVATPARQLRVYLTALQYLSHIRLINMPPELSIDDNLLIFQQKGEDFTKQLTGEIDRLLVYPERGLCESVIIPENIIEAYNQVRTKT